MRLHAHGHLRAFVLLTCLAPLPAAAQLGVSSDRVTLPNGPGSRAGLGANTDVNLNMGQVSVSLPLDVPKGFDGATPELTLSYSSGGGGGVVGMGWSLPFRTLERMTVKGVPSYNLEDRMVADGGTDLVRVSTSPRVYRAREESGFVRYTWLDAGTAGTGGYWKAEDPDGNVAWLGAQRDGTVQASAQLQNGGRTFRWNLVHVEDRHGHLMEYGYTPLNGIPMVTSIRWVQEEAGAFRYRVTLEYEMRPDALSDARMGFEERVLHRLKAVNVFNGSTRLRRYELTYEDMATSGGFSRLAGLRRLGLTGTEYPEKHTFSYTQALGGVCTGTACQQPYLVNMGTLGVSLQSRGATLLDVNGDAMPDVLDTSATGAHRFFLSQMDAQGSHTFGPAQQSIVGTGSGFGLNSTSVQEMDINGDGFTDLVNVRTGRVLVNLGGGDWDADVALGGAVDMGLAGEFELASVTADGDLQGIRFFDHNGDRRMDIIRTASGTTSIFESNGMNGFSELNGAEAIGWGFVEDNMQMQDMNGDGLLDPVILRSGQVSYRLNLGGGRWGPVVDIMNVPFTNAQELAQVDMEDINGDGLTDLVLVTGTQVRFSLNRSGTAFGALSTVDNAAGGSIPERLETTSVLYADMNGNGSDEVVWVNANGNVTYLELFPGRPNLLARMDNGLGAVTEYAFTTSVRERARDAAAGVVWNHKLPSPMVMVSRTDGYDLFSNVHERVEYQYHHGFFDGVERRFRGFADVEELLEGDTFQQAGARRTLFDVGTVTPEKHGTVLSVTSESRGNTDAVLESTTHSYDLCPVADVPASVVFVCKRASVTTHREGRPDAEAFQTREEWTYDGHGNVTRHARLGVVSHADGSGCAPCDSTPAGTFGEACGPTCTGDETFTTTQHVPPSATGGRWMLRLVSVRRESAVDSGTSFEEVSTHYDGTEFVGLPLGQATVGNVSRVTLRTDDAGATVNAQRHRHDGHGNIVEHLDGLGAPASNGHRTLYTYSPNGLFQLTETSTNVDAAGAPYGLRRDVSFDPTWDLPAEQTDWMLVRGGSMTARNATLLTYDDFGRVAGVLHPGDTNALAATTETTYELASPVSRIVSTMRSQAAGARDLESIRCEDGLGRVVQTRSRVAAGVYQVSGLTVFNTRGQEVRVYQPYTSTSGACDTAAPAGTRFVETHLDALGRTLDEIQADGGIERTTYLPLVEEERDQNDTTAGNSHFNTPTITFKDGLDRDVRLVRQMGMGVPAETVRIRYDVFGNVAHVTDAAGHVRTQTFDNAGRVTRTVDPNAGTTTFTHDAASNLVTRTDARGLTVQRTFDGLNRMTELVDTADATTRITFTYDLAPEGCPGADCTHVPGRLAARSFPVARAGGPATQGQDLMGYNVRGNLTLSRRVLGGATFDTRHTYDNAERLVSTAYPGALSVTQVLDGLSRTTSVAGVVDNVTYAAQGELATVVRHNGVTDALERDAELDVTRLRAERAGSAVMDLAYTRDPAGNVLTVADSGANAASRPRHDMAFRYDAAYRVVEAQLGPAPAAETLTYTFDAVDNLTSLVSSRGAQSSAHVGTMTYQPNHPNALAQAGSRPYAVDAAGYVTTRGASTLSWDVFGRLRTESQGATQNLSIGYGPDHLRVVREEAGGETWNVGPGLAVRDGVVEVTVKVAGEPVALLESTTLAAALLGDLAPATGSGTLTPQADATVSAADAWLRHAAAEGILTVTGAASAADATLMLRSSARRLLADASGGQLHLHADLKGSVVAATDASGNLLGHRAFHPHGPFREGVPLGPLGYEGQEETSGGLALFAYRALDLGVARFSSVDLQYALLDAEALDDWGEMMAGYALEAGNFSTHVDPLGLNKERPKTLRPKSKVFRAKEVTSRQWTLKAQALQEKHPKLAGALNRTTKVLFGLRLDATAAAAGTLATFARLNVNAGSVRRKATPLERTKLVGKVAGMLALRLALAPLGDARLPVLRVLTGRHPTSGLTFKSLREQKKMQAIRAQSERYNRRVD